MSSPEISSTSRQPTACASGKASALLPRTQPHLPTMSALSSSFAAPPSEEPQKVYVCDGAKPSKTGGESARKMKAAAKAFLTSTHSARVTRAAPPERCELATYVRHGLMQTPLRQTRPVFPQSASSVQVFGQPPMKHAGADVYSVREPTAQKISTTPPSQPQRPPGSMQ
jgi:hypothetical protein